MHDKTKNLTQPSSSKKGGSLKAKRLFFYQWTGSIFSENHRKNLHLKPLIEKILAVPGIRQADIPKTKF